MQYTVGVTRLAVDLQATSCMKVPFSILLTNEASETGIASTLLDCQTQKTKGSCCCSMLPLESMLFESLIAAHMSCLCAKRCTSHPEDCVAFVGPWQWPRSISCSKETKNDQEQKADELC